MALCTSGGAAPSALELDSGHMSRQAAASPMSRLSHAPNTPHSLMRIDGSPPHVFVTQWSWDAVPPAKQTQPKHTTGAHLGVC